MALQIARPRPVPPTLRVPLRSDWANFWKIRVENSVGMPGPRSRTSKRIRPAVRWAAATSTTLPSAANLAAKMRPRKDDEQG